MGVDRHKASRLPGKGWAERTLGNQDALQIPSFRPYRNRAPVPCLALAHVRSSVTL